MDVTNSICIAVKLFVLSFSAILLILTLNIYRILPQLRRMLDACTLNMIVCGIVVAFMKMNLLFEQKYSNPYNIYALIMSFFTVAFFMWIKCAMLTVYRTIILGNSIVDDRDNSWFYINMYAWLPSILLLVFPFIYAKVFDTKFSYVKTVIDVHYLTVCAILMFLILICFWLILILTKTQNHGIPNRQFRSLNYMFNLSFIILMVAGCSWTIGLFSLFLPKNMNFLNTLLECVDCASGIGMFFVLICCRPRVKKLLANRTVFGIVMPSNWATLEQVE